jgi:hypothetical protein
MQPPRMIALVPHLTTNCRVRHVRVSVPLIAALVDNERYYLPDELPAPAGEELRAMFRPKIAQVKAPPRAPRAPTLRTLVRYALKCESAEELGKKLKRRYDRQQQRRGVYARRSPSAADMADLERLIGTK